jgi:hypothetical protein
MATASIRDGAWPRRSGPGRGTAAGFIDAGRRPALHAQDAEGDASRESPRTQRAGNVGLGRRVTRRANAAATDRRTAPAFIPDESGPRRSGPGKRTAEVTAAAGRRPALGGGVCTHDRPSTASTRGASTGSRRVTRHVISSAPCRQTNPASGADGQTATSRVSGPRGSLPGSGYLSISPIITFRRLDIPASARNLQFAGRSRSPGPGVPNEGRHCGSRDRHSVPVPFDSTARPRDASANEGYVAWSSVSRGGDSTARDPIRGRTGIPVALRRSCVDRAVRRSAEPRRGMPTQGKAEHPAWPPEPAKDAGGVCDRMHVVHERGGVGG